MSYIKRVVVTSLIVACSIIPPIAFYLFSNVPTMSPKGVKALLQKEPYNTLLLDVRDRREFDKMHINPSFNIPYDDLLAGNITDYQSELLKDKTVIVLCESGIASSEVTRKLINRGINTFNIKGGMDAWIADAGKAPPGITSFEAQPGEGLLFTFRVAPSHEQWLAVFTGYGVKPLYTILSLILFMTLWRKDEIELKTLKYSMIFFFLGENFCAVNYLFYSHQSYLLEYFHSLGMVVSFAFAAYSLLEWMDKYVFNYSDLLKKCVFVYLCRECSKYKEVSCALKRISIFLCFSAAAVSLMPLFAEIKMISYNTEIWGTIYNYSHHAVYQLFEIRYCPIVAATAFIIAGLILTFKKSDPIPLSKVFIASGSGAAGFSLFRFVLFHAYHDNLVWMEFWEEITELLFITGLAFFLWHFYRPIFTKK
ncbi:rhodanese-like domain-containing protein [Thermodesulfobacteriota bacterium]